MPPPCDSSAPSVGPGTGTPTCGSDSVIDVNRTAVRDGADLRVRVDTRGRRNELHPQCVDRDSTEAMLRYQAPPASGHVQALRVSSIACGTEYDTVLAMRNDCGPEYHDVSCNNDALDSNQRETRRSTVYYTDITPEQYLYILVDGFDGSQGTAELVITEIPEEGVAFAPCLPVPDSMANIPGIDIAPFRCPNEGIRCRPGAASDGTDLCLPVVAVGTSCDPEERTNVCDGVSAGVLCATNPMSPGAGVCASPGTAPGARCRTVAPRCDGGLACSPGAGPGGRDICVTVRASGETCDPSPNGFVDQCDTGLTCCGEAADAGVNYVCRSNGASCLPYMPGG